MRDFFLHPGPRGLARMEGALRAKPVWEDDFLMVFTHERYFDPETMELAAQAFQKNPLVTYQGLFFLAFEVPPTGGHMLAQAAYLKYRQDHPLPASFQQDNLVLMLAGDSSLLQTDTVFSALDAAWPRLSPGERGRILKGLADSHLEDRTFVPTGFQNHDLFVRAKKKAYIRATKTQRPQMYALLKGTHLFNLEPPVLPQLERFLENPSELTLETLRKACGSRSKDEAAPDLSELSPYLFSLADRQLERGDIYAARGLLMLADRHCVHPTSKGEGPVAWLGSTRICHYPEIFVEAIAEERPAAKTVAAVMDFENPERWARCNPDGETIGKTFRETKLHLLSHIETQGPIEEEVLTNIFKAYRFSQKASALRESSDE